MTTDPFSAKIRRFITPELNCKLERQCAYFSLVDRDPKSLLPEEISKRIADLEQLERDEGFAYVGEKQWLEEVKSGATMTYGAWTQHVLLSKVFKKFKPKKEEDRPAGFGPLRVAAAVAGALYWFDGAWCADFEPKQWLHVTPKEDDQICGSLGFCSTAGRQGERDKLPDQRDYQRVFYAMHNIRFFVLVVWQAELECVEIDVWDYHAIHADLTFGFVFFDYALGFGENTSSDFINDPNCKTLIYDHPHDRQIIEKRYEKLKKRVTCSAEAPWLNHLMQNPETTISYPDWIAPILKDRIFKSGFEWHPERMDGFELNEQRPEAVNGCWSTELASISGFDLGMEELNRIQLQGPPCIPLHLPLRVSFEGGKGLPPSNELLADLYEYIVNLDSFSYQNGLTLQKAKPIPEGSTIQGIYLFQRRPYWQLEVLTPENEPIHLDFCRRGHIFRLPPRGVCG